MKQEMEIKRFTLGTLFKFFLTSLIAGVGPLIILEGILEILGVIPPFVSAGAGAVKTTDILLSSIFLAISLPFSLAFVLTVFLGLGHWIYSLFTSLIIRFYEVMPKRGPTL